ncbi:hypothetical protein GCM10018781_80000 [Kitasatospora indigofera]|uniref:Uncharacterized protein n=1 Tax=Kitasatospora indigofera TaxID=67307 RepID=A0A918YXL5_9ACTN|nr:hypothetical protein [Kitasatospora indigofera]GHE27404.1 hypothetical protein GCM10018781_80000 [Kitasatospora indigofera]
MNTEHDPKHEPHPASEEGEDSEGQNLGEQQGDATTADPTPARHVGPDDRPDAEEPSR